MTSKARAESIVSALDAALTDTLGVRRASSLDEFLAPGAGARCLLRPALRIAHHFDITPAFLILDPVLGSLGLVEVTLAEAAGEAQVIGRLVRRHLDAATYARHRCCATPAWAGARR